MTPYGIAEAAALTGLTATTLRYYERDGLLLGPVHRATSGAPPVQRARPALDHAADAAAGHRDADARRPRAHLDAVDVKIALYEDRVRASREAARLPA